MLKKCIFAVVILLFLSGTLFASENGEPLSKDKAQSQNNKPFIYEKGNIILAPKIGLGNSLPPDVFIDATPQQTMAVSVGAALEYFVMDNFSVVVELLYERQPIHYKGKDDAIMYIYNFNYITIPVGVRYSFYEHFLVGGGLYYGIKYNSEHSLKIGYNTTSFGSPPNEKNDVGLFVDAGLNLALSKSNNLPLYYNLSLYFRYKMGFFELMEDRKLSTSTLTFNVAYGVRF